MNKPVWCVLIILLVIITACTSSNRYIPRGVPDQRNPPSEINAPQCGNNVCEQSETCQTCGKDCGACSTTGCGNGVCSADETTLTCAKDCPLNIAPKELWMHPNNWNDVWANDESQWDTVVNSLDVFGFFGLQIKNSQGSAFQVSLLKQKNVRVNVEIGALRPFQCDGASFFEQQDKPIFDKLVAGGHSDFIASMDAPFAYTVQDGFHSQCAQLFNAGAMDKFNAAACDPSISISCNLNIDQVANEVVEYLALFRERYPDASIGWIEPLPLFRFGTFPGGDPPAGKPYPDFKVISNTLMEKIAAYNAAHALDINLRFFHSDWYFTGMFVPAIQQTYDAWDKHIAISNHLRSKGLRFGILMNDYRENLPTLEQKNKLFSENTLQYYDCWHAKGGTFDDIVVESWVGDHPSQQVPEEQPYTFTNVMVELIKRITQPNYAPTCDEKKIINSIISIPTGPPTNFDPR